MIITNKITPPDAIVMENHFGILLEWILLKVIAWFNPVKKNTISTNIATVNRYTQNVGLVVFYVTTIKSN